MDLHDLVRNAELLKTKDTEKLLTTVAGDENIKNLFRLMLDTSIVYNITGIPQTYASEAPCDISTDRALWSHLELLLRMKLRGDALKRKVQGIYNSCDLHRAKVFEWILDRQNPAKISAKMCNRVWSGLMYEQLYMGAVPSDATSLGNLPWAEGVMVEVKENGMTLIGFTDGENTTLRTRNGTDLTEHFPMTAVSIAQLHSELNFTTGVLFHFEAHVLVNTFGSNTLRREAGNALITAQVTNGIKGGELDERITLVLLDYYDWTGTNAFDRYNKFSEMKPDLWLRPVEGYLIYNVTDAKDWARQLISEGGEGVICKDKSKPWTNGKPLFNVKIKHEFEVELRVTGIKPHSKNPSLIGSLLCSSEDGLLEVAVGSGLTDEQRSEPWDSWLNSIVTVRSEYITSSKGKKKPSLNNPRVVELRFFDKNKADTLDEIQKQYTASKEV